MGVADYPDFFVPLGTNESEYFESMSGGFILFCI